MPNGRIERARVVVEEWRLLRERSGNPLWTWRAYRRCRQVACEIPSWIWSDFDEIARRLDSESSRRFAADRADGALPWAEFPSSSDPNAPREVNAKRAVKRLLRNARTSSQEVHAKRPQKAIMRAFGFVDRGDPFLSALRSERDAAIAGASLSANGKRWSADTDAAKTASLSERTARRARRKYQRT